MNLKKLKREGFDKSETSSENRRAVRVRCSQCVSMVINGVAVHERGCPNERRSR